MNTTFLKNNLKASNLKIVKLFKVSQSCITSLLIEFNMNTTFLIK